MGKQGFTLIEVLIAFGLMITVLVALVYSLTQAVEVTNVARNQDIALAAISDKFEEIANDLNNIATYDGQVFAVQADTGAGLVDLLATPPGMANPGLVTINGLAANLFDVTVRVSWQQKPGRAASFRELTTTFTL